MSKQRLLLLFGGRSTEHEISCLSAGNIAKNIDTERYELFLVGITKEGSWRLASGIPALLDGSWHQSDTYASLLPDADLQSLLLCLPDGTQRLERIDLIFPVLHGKNGEDGTVQGLFALSRIPYVGCGVLSSAVSMDKAYTKLIAEAPLRALHVRQARYLSFQEAALSDLKGCAEQVEQVFPYPVFVKPSNAGSSCGVSRAENRDALILGIQKALEVDRKVLVEEAIVGRELECAVFRSGDEVHASGIGEIKAAASFYDYDAKYHNPDSETDIDPALPDAVREQIRAAAKAVFRAVDGYGLARVDFFLDEKGPVFNEINTMPGFTAISMYPMPWEAQGIDKKQLVQRLIDSALLRP